MNCLTLKLTPKLIYPQMFRGVIFLLCILGTQLNSYSQLDCSRAITLTCPYDEVFSTFNEVNNVTTYCNNSNQGYTGDEVVYIFNPPSSGDYNFLMTGVASGDDLDIFVLNSCSNNSCIANSDGQSGSSPDDITVPLSASQTYYVIIDTDVLSGNDESNYRLRVTGCNDEGGGCPSGDCTDHEETLSCSKTTRTGRVSSSDGNDFNANCFYSPLGCYNGQSSFDGSDEIIRLDLGSPARTYEIKLTGLTADLDLFLFDRCTSGELRECVGNSLNSSNTSESIIVPNASGIYYLIIDSYQAGISSDYKLEIIGCSPTQNPCTGAKPITCNERLCCETTAGKTNNFTTSNSNYNACRDGISDQTYNAPDNVYSFRKENSSDIVTIELDHSTNINLSLFILDECNASSGGTLTGTTELKSGNNVACIGSGINTPDDRDPDGEIWTDNGSLPVGTYYIIIDGINSLSFGPFSLEVRCEPACPEGDCDKREGLTLTCADNVRTGVISSSDTNDFNAECHYRPLSCYNGNSSFNGADEVRRIDIGSTVQDLTIRLTGLRNDLDMFVFDNCRSGEFSNCVGNSLNPNANSESITIPNASGIYYVVIDAHSAGISSEYTLTIECDQDDLPCDQAMPIACNQRLTNLTTQGADNNFNSGIFDYNSCRSGVSTQTFNAGDKLFVFTKQNSADIVTIEMDHSTNINLAMFVLNSCGLTSANCAGSGSNTPSNTDPDGEIWTDNGQLPAGTYYILIDGINPQSVGAFTLDLKCETACQDTSGELDCSGVMDLIPGQHINNACGKRLRNVRTDDAIYYCNDTSTKYCADEVIFRYTLRGGVKYRFSVGHGIEQPKIFLLDSCNRNDCIGVSNPAPGGEMDVIEYGVCEDKTIYLVVDEEDATDWGACIQVEEIGTVEDCDGCKDSCCNDSNETLREIIEREKASCQDGYDIAIYECIYNGQCSYSVIRTKITPAVYDYFSVLSTYSPSGEIVDCEGRTSLTFDYETSFNVSFANQATECNLVWTCDGYEDEGYNCEEECYESCCSNTDFIDQLIDFRSTLTGECLAGPITQAMWRGQCVYLLYPDLNIIDAGISVVDCEGSYLFGFGGFVDEETARQQAELANDIMDEVEIWSCDKMRDKCNEACDDSCCMDNNKTLKEIIERESLKCADGYNVAIYQCTINGQCSYSILRTKITPAIYEYSAFVVDNSPSGEVVDCQGRVSFSFDYANDFNVSFANQATLCDLVWTCDGYEDEDCDDTGGGGDDCDDSCCNDNLKTLNEIIEREKMKCADGVDVAIYACTYNGQCSYSVIRTDVFPAITTYDEVIRQYTPSGEVIDCQGRMAFSFDYENDFNVSFANQATQCVLVWNCDGYADPDCGDGNGGGNSGGGDCEPVSCEDFSGYSSSLNISSQSNKWIKDPFGFGENDCIVQNNNLVAKRGPNNECSSLYQLEQSNATQIRISFDLQMPYYNLGSSPLEAGGAEIYLTEPNGGDQIYFGFRSHDNQSGDPLVNLQVGNVYFSPNDEEPVSFPKNQFFTINVDLNKSTEEIRIYVDGNLFKTVNNSGISALDGIAIRTALNTGEQSEFLIDNICIENCAGGGGNGGGNTGGCDTCCDDSGEGLSSIINRAQSRCGDEFAYAVYECEYKGRCSFTILKARADSRFDLETYEVIVEEDNPLGEVFDCGGNMLFSFDYAVNLNIANFADNISNCNLLWTCDGLGECGSALSGGSLQEAETRSIIEPISEVRVYPNPFNDVLNISIPSTTEQDAVLNIYSISGQQVIKRNLSLEKGSNTFEWNETMNLEAGYYMYTIHTATKQYSGKVLKMK